MKLSMWILKDYLKEFHPVAHIQSGARVLRNVRLFSDAELTVNTNVYLGRADEFIDGEEKKVICVHGQDMLLLATEDINEVFNRILDCFDFYNLWYDECMNLIQRECSIQDILEISRPLFHERVFVADRSYVVLNAIETALPENMELTEQQKRQIEFSEMTRKNSTMPISYILQTRRDKRIYKNLEHGYTLIVDEEELPVSIVNLFYKGTLWGWVLESNTLTKCTKGKMQILEVLGQVLENWLLGDFKSRRSLENFSDIFENVFQKEDREDCAKLERHLRNIGWSGEEKKRILLIENEREDRAVLANLCYRLNSEGAGVSCILEDKALLLYNLDMQEKKRFLPEFEKLLRESFCRAGASYVFTEIRQIKEQKILAETALMYGEKTVGCINKCEDYILTYLKEVVAANSHIDFYHPAVKQLEEYDAENGTQLLPTLYHFLCMERSYNNTAKKMFVHRNTIQYRIEKILELTEVDLDDFSVRSHLLLSLYIKNSP